MVGNIFSRGKICQIFFTHPWSTTTPAPDITLHRHSSWLSETSEKLLAVCKGKKYCEENGN